ncbi:MAG: hypothetical protein AB7Q17_13520 [Phycisphaerae bacterium]
MFHRVRAALALAAAIGGAALPALGQVAPVESGSTGYADLAEAWVAHGGVAGIGAPDLIISETSTPIRWGTIDGVTSYSFSISTCNIGDGVALVRDTSSFRPVSVQNLYRLSDGRLEQLGMSWAFHQFCALNTARCGTCEAPCPTTCCDLGIGCASPDSASAMGSHFRLAKRSEINAFTSEFSYPPASMSSSGNVLFKRLQVSNADLDPALNPGAQYFVEHVVASRDEAAAGHGLNNASHGRVLVGSFSNGGYNLTVPATAVTNAPAIQAWRDHGLGPGQPDASVQIATVDVPGEGRFYVGAKATQLNAAMWQYQYAVFNLNSHRSAREFRVPLGADVVAADVGFHDVAYHSGETYSGADWTSGVASGVLTWATETFAQNADANALRWGTLYNFRFHANAAPADGPVTLGLFRPGTPGEVSAVLARPGAVTFAAGDLNCDGVVNNFDIDPFVQALTDPPGYAAEYPGCSIALGDVNGDGAVNNFDIDAFVVLLTGP